MWWKMYTAVFVASLALTSANKKRDMLNPYAAGTTRNLEAIFIGRCYEHQQCLQTDRCVPSEPPSASCSDLWQSFYETFSYKDPCNTLEDAYDSFLGQAKPYSPDDQILFWSGLLDAALNVARVSQVYRILEESLPGYIANNLVWCGHESNQDEGIDYVSCPSTNDCDRGETMFTFWQAASRDFAKQAKGHVSVALNSHRTGGAFHEDSVFATIELPNLIPEQVEMVEILLVPDVKLLDFDDAPEERCGEGSVLTLQRKIEDYDMLWECTYDPIEFHNIQCTTLANPEDYSACNSADSVGRISSLLSAITVTAIIGHLLSNRH